MQLDSRAVRRLEITEARITLAYLQGLVTGLTCAQAGSVPDQTARLEQARAEADRAFGDLQRLCAADHGVEVSHDDA